MIDAAFRQFERMPQAQLLMREIQRLFDETAFRHHSKDRSVQFRLT